MPFQWRLNVRVYVSESGLPLTGLKLELSQPTLPQAQLLATAKTDQKGRAVLKPDLRSIPVLGLNGRPLQVTLYNQQGKPVLRKSVDPRSNQRAQKLSLPISNAQLVLYGLLPGKGKARSNEAKRKALCDAWQKRLGNLSAHDPHVTDDLCLTEMMLATLSNLKDPTTELGQALSKRLAPYLEDTDPEVVQAVMKKAEEARAALKDCLGEKYPDCEVPPTLDELGKILLEENDRFKSAAEVFSSPVPDPTLDPNDAQNGVGWSTPIDWVKDCIDDYEAILGADPDTVDAETRALLEALYPDGGVLVPPSVNYLEVWDPNFGGGDIVRKCDLHDKTLTLRVLNSDGGSLQVVDRDLAMDVELDSPDCLIHETDASGFQIVATDIQPGQKVHLYGSGFVSKEAVLRVDFRNWKPEPLAGQLVPDDDILPVNGLSNIVVPVHGDGSPPPQDANPETYNLDQIVFEWPEAAAKEGLYRLRIEFENNNFVTAITQNPDDCSLSAEYGQLLTQELYFFVVPPVQKPPIRILGRDVECLDITDPEGYLGLPWPDDILFSASAIKDRLVIAASESGVDISVEEGEPLNRNESFMFYNPGTWTPNLQLFPEQSGFAQLDALEYVVADFKLDEVEGNFDKFVVSLMYLAVLILIALVAAAIFTAIAVAVAAAFVAATSLTWGAAIPLIVAVLKLVLPFIFGAAFTALAGLVPTLLLFVNGADLVLSHSSLYDGQRLMYRLSPIRFHRVLWALEEDEDDEPTLENEASLQEEVENQALGGSYQLNVLVEAS